MRIPVVCMCEYTHMFEERRESSRATRRTFDNDVKPMMNNTRGFSYEMEVGPIVDLVFQRTTTSV